MMITSDRLTSELVVASRRRSISSLIEASFSIIDIALRDVGLGLIVVVVAYEVVNGVVGKELLELGIQLGGQGLVMRDDQGGPLQTLDDVGHGERLPRAGNALENVMLSALQKPIGQLGNRLGLITGWLE